MNLKTSLVLATILLVGAVVFFAFPGTSTEYGTLFDRVEATRAAASLGSHLDRTRARYVETTVAQEVASAQAKVDTERAQADYWRTQSDKEALDLFSQKLTVGVGLAAFVGAVAFLVFVILRGRKTSTYDHDAY